MRAKFLRICPYGTTYLNQLVAECIREILWVSLIAVLVIWMWNTFWERNSGLYVWGSVFLAIYLAALEVPNYKLQERENRVYRELLMYFSRVKHRYMACRHIPNAVLDASENMSYEIQCLAGEVYRVLMESNRKEKVREYVTYQPTNGYLKLFLVQAYEASDKGDIILSEECSMFSENVEHLRLELMEELYRRKRRAHEFAGYTFVSVAPFFLMPVLKQWGLDFVPELDFFYAGTGVLLELLTFCATIIVYGMLGRAKEIVLYAEGTETKVWNVEWFYRSPIVAAMVRHLEQMKGAFSFAVRRLLLLSGERTTYGRLCAKMLCIAAFTFVLLLTFCASLHGRERRTVLQQVETIDTIAPVASTEKKKMLEKHILEITGQCRTRPDCSENEIRELLRTKIRLGSESMETAAVQEIRNKILQYSKARMTFWEVFFCIVGSAAVGALPLFKLRFQVQASRAEAVHEVRQLQSIIIMERRLHGMTVVGLLEDMEVFSKNFKHVLRKCINSYGAGPKEALLHLKEEGGSIQEGFIELADAFLSVDEVGIAMAFSEVESNRRLLEKMTQLEAEISMEKKKDSADLLAKVPMILAVGIYFILPFFVHSLLGVAEVFKMLEEMQM